MRPTLFIRNATRVGHVANDLALPEAPKAAVPAAFAADAAAAGRVSAPFAGSVAGVFVRPAAASLDQRSFALSVGGPVPASVVVSGDPVPASGIACSAVAGISGPV